jgi:hypothetical protein
MTYSFDDLYPTNYVSVADLNGKPCTLTIAAVTREEMPDGKMKPALSFKGAQKRFLLNRTNGNTLRELFGEPDRWVGQRVELYGTTTSFQGRMVPCVRVRPASPPGAPAAPAATPVFHGPQAAAAAAQQPLDQQLDDEIPF